MPETAELRLSEAVPLAHALVARLAALEGVRVLFIKGPTAVALGARPPRPSTDVDVLCEAGGMERLGAALETCNWRRRVGKGSAHELEYGSQYLFDHSLHYIHDEWPCDIDVHYSFPGFLAPDEVVFEALWARRTSVDIAHWPVACPDLAGQSAIVALHALREPKADLSRVDLDHLKGLMRQPGAQLAESLESLAASTGCSSTLHPLIDPSYAAMPAAAPLQDAEALRRWRIRTQDAGAYTTSWLIEMRHAGWRRRAELLWRDFFPPQDVVFSRHAGLQRSWPTVARLYASRWWTAARHLPRGIRAARTSVRVDQ